VKLRLSIDRFEGDKKSIAVLLTDDGAPIKFPIELLPRGVKAGDVLTFTIERDIVATRNVANETHAVQDQLKSTDPGGDVAL
jgi:Protein of unknown function (DUF3006)